MPFLADFQLLPPIPLLVSKQLEIETKRVVNLNRHGLGDRQVKAFVEGGLSRLAQQGVSVEEVHLADNGIREAATVAAIGEALKSCPKLQTLDLSNNVIGRDGAVSLAAALESCPTLQKLTLSKIGVDDKAMSLLINGLLDHPVLVIMDLSHNELGRTAATKQVRQNGLTGFTSESLSTLIQSGEALQKLTLSWNSLRGAAATRIALAVEFNSMLTHLELSRNAFGTGGADEALSEALRGHKWLKYLGLAHNGIRERGAVMLGDMLKENKALEMVVLDGNPIGIRGGRMILRALHCFGRFGWKRQVSITGCNYKFTDDSVEIFDPQRPGGEYSLDLSEPYQRFVAWELVDLAWCDTAFH